MCVWKQVATLILDVADVMGDDYMTKGEIGVFKHEWIDLTESRKTIADRYNPCQHLCRQSLSKLTVFAPKSALSVQKCDRAHWCFKRGSNLDGMEGTQEHLHKKANHAKVHGYLLVIKPSFQAHVRYTFALHLFFCLLSHSVLLMLQIARTCIELVRWDICEVMVDKLYNPSVDMQVRQWMDVSCVCGVEFSSILLATQKICARQTLNPRACVCVYVCVCVCVLKILLVFMHVYACRNTVGGCKMSGALLG